MNDHIYALAQALALSTNTLACVESAISELEYDAETELSEIESNAHETINILTRIRNDLSDQETAASTQKRETL